MIRAGRLIIIIAVSLCLFGCSTDSVSKNDNSLSVESVTENTDVSDDSENYDIGSDIAVLSINTKSDAEDALDFVTEPVSRYVAESIASWTPGYKIPSEPYYEECTITLTDADDNVMLDSVDSQVKVRGNWTTMYEKKPLRIKFAEKQSMLGLNGGAEMKNWVLLAEYKDGSMLRNKTALSISGEILEEDELYAADAELVEVEINGQYWGIYLLTEFQQINSDRVDITEAEKDYTGTDIGYFMEFDGYFENEDPLNSIHVDYADNAPLVPFNGEEENGETIKCLPDSPNSEKNDVGITIKNDIYSEEQHDFIESYMNNVYRILYYAAYEDKAYEFNADFTEISESDNISTKEAIEKVIDVNSLADMYIISELTCDADIYWSSFFMDVDFGESGNKKLTFEAPWDFDSAMGNKERCTDGKGFFAANIVFDVNDRYKTINPWLAVLMYEDWFCEIIREKWTSACDSGIFERAYQMIETDMRQYSDAFERNYKRWNNIIDNETIKGELSDNAARCTNHIQASEYLLQWLKNRVEFLSDYWDN